MKEPNKVPIKRRNVTEYHLYVPYGDGEWLKIRNQDAKRLIEIHEFEQDITTVVLETHTYTVVNLLPTEYH